MDNKTVSPPSTLFSNTTTSYKFFWGLAIVDIYKESGQDSFHFNIIVSRMLYYAWLINDWQILNFGGADQLYRKAAYLARTMQSSSSNETLLDKLLNNLDNKHVNRVLTYFYENVPYRFLTPWVGTKITRNELSNENVMFGIEAPYCIKGRTITINPSWMDYFDSFYTQYRERIIYELTSFLLSRNPGKKITTEDIRRCLSDEKSHNYDTPKIVELSPASQEPIICPINENLLIATDFSDSEEIVDITGQSTEGVGGQVIEAAKSASTQTEISNGKVVYISNSELATQVLSVLRKDRIEAISILAFYYRDTPGLTMSLSDWDALLNTMSVDNDTDGIKETTPFIESSDHTTNNLEGSSQKQDDNYKKSSTGRCDSNRLLTKHISGFEEILKFCDDSLPFPSVNINSLSIHEAEIVVDLIFLSNSNNNEYEFEISFNDVSYFYVAIKPKDNETMDISIKPRVNVMSVKLSNKIIVTCKSASVKSIKQC